MLILFYINLVKVQIVLLLKKQELHFFCGRESTNKFHSFQGHLNPLDTRISKPPAGLCTACINIEVFFSKQSTNYLRENKRT